MKIDLSNVKIEDLMDEVFKRSDEVAIIGNFYYKEHIKEKLEYYGKNTKNIKAVMRKIGIFEYGGEFAKDDLEEVLIG